MPVMRPIEGSSGVVGVFRLVMAPVLRIEDLQIGEGAADIDGDPDRCATLSHVHGTLGSP